MRKYLSVFVLTSALAISACGGPKTTETVSLKAPTVLAQNDLAPHRIPAPAPKPEPKVHKHEVKKKKPVVRQTPRAARKRTQTVTPALTGAGVWDRLAACESGGNWSINTGNGYYGGLQFSLSSWRAVGGSGLPSNASRAEQISRGEALRAKQGWGAWPACSRKLGLR